MGILLVAVLPSRGGAQQVSVSHCAYDRYVVLEASPEFPSELADEVRKDLAVELGPRGFGVCASQSDVGELAAKVKVDQPSSGKVSIEVDDHTTGKRLARDVPLARIPEGGTALALAIAVDELLRASWAELLLRREPEVEETRRPEAPGEQDLAPKRLPVSARSSWRYVRTQRYALGALVGYSHTATAWDAALFEVRAEARPLGWGWLAAGIGGVMAREVDVSVGRASASGLFAALTLGGCTAEGQPLTGCAGARGTLHWTQFRGGAARGAESLEDDASAFVLSAVGQLRVRTTDRLAVVLELGVGGTVAAARATDGSTTLMAVEGVVVSSALGLGLSL